MALPIVDAHVDTDAAIIERSLTSPEAFATIFDRYSDDIYRYIARRLGPEVADDLMSETFVVAFRQRSRFDVSQPAARPWLYGIATNLVGNHRRAEARRWRAYARVPAPPSDEPLADRVADQVTAQAARPRLAKALAALPARHRDVLLLIAWGDLDYGEAAHALGVPIGTVRSRLSRARASLRKQLDAVAAPIHQTSNFDNQGFHHG